MLNYYATKIVCGNYNYIQIIVKEYLRNNSNLFLELIKCYDSFSNYIYISCNTCDFRIMNLKYMSFNEMIVSKNKHQTNWLRTL